jgi:hypothetical protein
MKMLRSRLYEFELEKKREISKKLEDSKLEINFGSQIRSYVLQPYRMAKDHRTKVEVGDVDKVLDGYLEPFLRGYLLAKRRGTAVAAGPEFICAGEVNGDSGPARNGNCIWRRHARAACAGCERERGVLRSAARVQGRFPSARLFCVGFARQVQPLPLRGRPGPHRSLGVD